MSYFFAVIIIIITIIGFSLLSITQVLLLSNNNSYKAYGSLPDFNFAAAGDRDAEVVPHVQ